MVNKDIQKKLFSFRYLNSDNKGNYLNNIKIDLEEERNHFLNTKGDSELYHLYRLAYDCYLAKNNDKVEQSFYIFHERKPRNL
jgi:hypothetical protein